MLQPAITKAQLAQPTASCSAEILRQTFGKEWLLKTHKRRRSFRQTVAKHAEG